MNPKAIILEFAYSSCSNMTKYVKVSQGADISDLCDAFGLDHVQFAGHPQNRVVDTKELKKGPLKHGMVYWTGKDISLCPLEYRERFLNLTEITHTSE